MSLPPGSVIVITGASSGIGRALASRLARGGARLALVARGAEGLAAAAAEVHAAGGQALALPADVTDGARCVSLIEEITAQLGPIDALVNNAGRADQGLTSLLEDDTLDEMMALCVRAPLRLIQATLPGMRARGRGHILNVVSHAAFHGFGVTPGYAMAKAALHALTLNLAYELADTDIHVTGVYPGLVDTSFARAMTPAGGTTAELMAWMRHFRAGLKASPTFKEIERAQRPEEVAEIIAAALEEPGAPLVFTQPVHQRAVAEMIADPAAWAQAAGAFYSAFIPPLRDMLGRFVGLAREEREAARRAEAHR